MIIDNIFSFFFGIILTFLFQRVLGSNQQFFKIVNEFIKLLPPRDKRATKKLNPQLGIQHMDLNTQKTNIETKELDYFLKQLEDFNYEGIYFRKKAIKAYSENIQRIIKTTDWEAFGIGILQDILDNKDGESRKPFILGPKIAKYLNC